MSASAEIFRFPGRTAANGNSGAWSNQDIADVYRCLDQFARQGLTVEASSGMSDEGDPWFAIEDVGTGDALIHIARIDGFFIVHVLDGETWSGDTLRAALSQIETASLLDGVPAAHHDAGVADGDDDKDGTHAFLRIVSAVVAVLTADVIASAVTHEAAASPLPPTDAPNADDHTFDASKAFLDLPAVDEAVVAAHRDESQSAPASDAGAAQTPSVEIKTAGIAGNTTIDTPAASGADAAKPVVTPQIDAVHAGDVVDTSPQPQALKAMVDAGSGIAMSFRAQGGEHVQVAFNDNASFIGSDKKADLFLIILGKDDQELTTKVGNFEEGHDSLVIEKSDGDSTSSAIITDLGTLVANNVSNLTVIGQATVELHLSSVTASLVAGG